MRYSLYDPVNVKKSRLMAGSYLFKILYRALTNSFGCFDHSSEGSDLKYS